MSAKIYLSDQQKFSINQNNIVTSEKILIANLKAIKLKIDKKDDNDEAERTEFVSLKFSQWFFSCPLLLSYVDPLQTELLELISEFVGENLLKVNFNMYEVLNKVGQFGTISSVKKRPNLSEPSDKDSSKGLSKWREDTSLSQTKYFPKLLELLNKDGFNIKEIFYQPKDTYNTGKQNKVIKGLFPLFGNNDYSAGKIRDFRTYLLKLGII
ncbi:hypothetical protein ACS126_12120 [Sphingobacterium lactis]|uniref:hypothetical protein n=1 Tax=Sphingobacterium lactis TaxID=797291 RepID=UPI003EC4FE00